MTSSGRNDMTPTTADQPAWSMLELPSPFSCERGVIRLLEDRDWTPEVFLRNLLSETYDRPFVFDNGVTRSLYFSLRYVQSTMRTRDPVSLEFAYTRKMMSFLLFQPQPRNILMLGLGGGSLAKYCHAHLPRCQITVVEIDPYVIGFREQFFIPADNAFFRVIHDDASAYIAQCPSRPDVIMMDAFDRDGFPAAIESGEFYRKAHAVLSPDGLLIANLAGSRSERLTHLNSIQEAFDDHLLVLQVGEDGNHVVVAFRNAMFEPRWQLIESQARELQAIHRIDFPRLAKKLERSKKLDYLARFNKVPERALWEG